MTAPHSLPRWLPVLLAWLALALIFLPQAWMLNLGRPEPLPLWQVTLRNSLIFVLWAALTPLAMAALRRWPPLGSARQGNRLRLVAVAITLSGVHLIAMAGLSLAATGTAVDPVRVLLSLTVGLAATNLLMVSALFAAGIAWMQYQARRAAEQQLAEARIATLRHQLQPHFLFNTLNVLAELVHSDAGLAESLLLKLSALLRRALDGSQVRRVSLREELDFLDDYLSIQSALYGDRLRVTRQVAADALHLLVPPMLLQPLVENALIHGVGVRKRGGRIDLRARETDAMLLLEITDDGVGATLPLVEGIGLHNTRERLTTEYAGRARMELRTARDEGFKVVIAVPQDAQ